MATLVSRQQTGYDVLAEALTADGRVVRRVEARADGLADVAEAFRLATAEARRAHLPVSRIHLTASRGGVTEIAVTDDLMGPEGPTAHSALLDGKTKVDQAASPRGADETHLTSIPPFTKRLVDRIWQLLGGGISIRVEMEQDSSIVRLIPSHPYFPIRAHLDYLQRFVLNVNEIAETMAEAMRKGC